MNRKQRRAAKAMGINLDRSPEQIKQEYAQLNSRAGDLQFMIYQHKQGLAEINARLEQLVQEYNQVSAKQKAAAAPTPEGASAEPTEAPPTPNPVASKIA